ncbi:MAG: hypothetical protein HKO62_12240 [Gammaproteobacteria bacterium]|nr:hypothetical protein [Gammaproteobacteria bacterium]
MEKATIETKIGSEINFAVVFAVVFGIIALYPLLKGGDIRIWAAVVSVLILAVGLLKPSLLRTPNILWFKLGLALGAIVAPIVMFLVYVVAIVPTGLCLRLFGKDPLDRKIEKDASTYWIEREQPLQSFKNQF